MTERKERRSAGWLWIWIGVFVVGTLIVLLWAWPARTPNAEDRQPGPAVEQVEGDEAPATNE
jgi:type VI protein secretion system component VasK